MHARGHTLTTDTEVSRLLSYQKGKKQEKIFILRGGKSQDSSVDKNKSSAGVGAERNKEPKQKGEAEE